MSSSDPQTMSNVATVKLPALSITRPFNGTTPRDSDGLFWVYVRGGLVALGHVNLWASAQRLRFIVHEIMVPQAKPLLQNRQTEAEGISIRALYRRWGVDPEPALAASPTASSLWPAYMAVVEDYRMLRDLRRATPAVISELEEWCMAGIQAVRSQPTPGLRAVLSWQTCSVVLPAFNEQDSVAATALDCVKTLWQLCPNCEVIIVDDGSSDETGVIADDLAANDATIVVIHNDKNKGYGGALRAGLEKAQGDLLFFMDSDGQFDFAEISKLFVVARDQPGTAVLGYRARRSDPFMRKLNALGWKVASRTVAGLRGIRDIDCAFKLFPAAAFLAAGVIAEGASINVEMLVKFQRMGIPIVQVPVTHLPRRSGSPTGAKLRVIMRAFRELFHLRRHLRHWQPHTIHDASSHEPFSLAYKEATVLASARAPNLQEI